jgi:lipoate-protein ligase A
MARDAAMLETSGQTGFALWRVYGWAEPSVTFGYSQSWRSIQVELPGFNGRCIRRITGGGIVDHRHDLTYALSLPYQHPFHRLPATDVYRGIHQLIADNLGSAGYNSELAPCQPCREERAPALASQCFQAPEPFDVVQAGTALKQAGAAMKRTRSGLLIQGSLSLAALPGLDRSSFSQSMKRGLQSWLSLEEAPAPKLDTSLIQNWEERFSSNKWNERR